MLAGLEEVDAGAILIGDRDVTDLPPKDRDIAMVFQNYALYPYLDRRREHRLPAEDGAACKKAERERARARGRASCSGSSEYLDRKPAQLSGGAAPAGRDGSGDRPQAERVPDGRAALEPRREAARADARRHRRAAARPRHDDGLRHPRPVRGDDARPPRRRARRRAAAAVGDAARALRPAGQPLRRRLHRLAGDEPLRGAVLERLGHASPASRSSSRRRSTGARRWSSDCARRRSSWRGDGIPARVEVVEEFGADAYVFCAARLHDGKGERPGWSLARRRDPPPSAASGSPCGSAPARPICSTWSRAGA